MDLKMQAVAADNHKKESQVKRNTFSFRSILIAHAHDKQEKLYEEKVSLLSGKLVISHNFLSVRLASAGILC